MHKLQSLVMQSEVVIDTRSDGQVSEKDERKYERSIDRTWGSTKVARVFRFRGNIALYIRVRVTNSIK